jgi:hypothetical protein
VLTRIAALILSVLAFSLVLPSSAEAQRRIYGGGWFVGPAWWQPFPYPYGRPNPYRYRADLHSVALRLDVDQKDAEVYVDGYLAGHVDDFDGVFQRLRVTPGEHEITIYLEGYRTLQERRYFNPDSGMTLRLRMEPLASGAPTAPRPVPSAPPADPAQARPEPPRPEPPARPQPAPRFGTLSLRVQPMDAEILIDGERWSAAAGETRVSIELAPGRHKIEVRKDGYKTYVEEVLIRPSATMTLNVSLSR